MDVTHTPRIDPWSTAKLPRISETRKCICFKCTVCVEGEWPEVSIIIGVSWNIMLSAPQLRFGNLLCISKHEYILVLLFPNVANGVAHLRNQVQPYKGKPLSVGYLKTFSPESFFSFKMPPLILSSPYLLIRIRRVCGFSRTCHKKQ